MSTHLCPKGHIAIIEENLRDGWANCAACNQWYERGQLRSTVTEEERRKDLADATMILAALEADPTLEARLAGMTYDEQVNFVRENNHA